MHFFKKVFFGSSKQESKSPNNATQKQQQSQQIPIQVLTQLFEKSAKYIGETTKVISDENKLTIYGIYKQATVGDCNTPKPSMLDFVGKSKWNAWRNNLGISKAQAMKAYVSKVVEIDPEIQKKMERFFEDGKQSQQKQQRQKQKGSAVQSTTGLKMVWQKDYSDNYSHPYFRSIQKNLPIQRQNITRELLLQRNSSPKCYPLHFAIDKERVDLVREFLEVLTLQEINQMQDQDGTGIEEYAELIQNEEIIQLVKEKIDNL